MSIVIKRTEGYEGKIKYMYGKDLFSGYEKANHMFLDGIFQDLHSVKPE